MKSRTKPALRVVPAVPVQLSLSVEGVLADVRHAFHGLCVAAGKQVLAAMMEADRQAACGARNVPDANRTAVRGGTTRSAVVLGGRRIAITRPRARSLEHGEVALPTFAWAAQADPLDAATMASMAAGVSTRRYAGTLDALPPPERSSSTSKSAVSRRWVALTQAQLDDWLSCSLKDMDLPVVMIDGIHFRERVILVALGIDAQGNKHVLGLREGSTEATRVVRSLLSDLVDRGLDADRARLWVIDGGKALRKAIVECFGRCALIQRCQEHKRRNVVEHLPEELHASVGRALRDAWDSGNAALAARQLQRLAASLAAKHPGAATSLREGLDDTLTVQRLGLTAVPNAAHDQPDREPERLDRALHAQRQALEGRTDDAALGGRRAQRCQGSLPQTARASRHEAAAGRADRSNPRTATRSTQGRVASRMRSRHLARFNSERDIALKGVGKVYVQVVIDTFCSLAFAKCYSFKMPITACDLLYKRVLPFYDALGVPVKAVLTDNGREFCGKAESHPYELLLALEDIEHRNTKIATPRTNGFVERMNRTLLDECFRVKGRETFYITIDEIQRDLDEFMAHYNLERSHQGYRLNGRTPAMALAEALGTRVKKLPNLRFKTEPLSAPPIEPSTSAETEATADTTNA